MAAEKPRAIRALLLDMDGLIVETESVQFEAFIEFTRRRGIEFPGGSYGEFVGVSVEENIALLQAEHGLRGEHAALVEERNRIYREMAAGRELEVCPGGAELLEAGRAAGLALGVVSSSEEAQVSLVLGKVFGQLKLSLGGRGLPGGRDLVVSAEAAERTKPAPDLYLVACRRLSLPPSAALVFEDSPSGAEAALAAGCPCVVVPGPYTRDLVFPEGTRRRGSLLDCAAERVWESSGAGG